MATFGNLETEVEPLAGLIREHTLVHGLVEAAREATEAALASAGDPDREAAAFEHLRDLDAFLQVDLVIHIAKEEEALFPALRGFAADIDKVVDEMVEQHDEVRLRKANIERALAALDHSHEQVEAGRDALASALSRAAGGDGVEALTTLLDAVKRLDWILQGHFGDEEDDLFVPALELLTPAQFAAMARQCEAIEARV